MLKRFWCTDYLGWKRGGCSMVVMMMIFIYVLCAG